jgi:UDP-N-acetylmuramate dehydrogenase
VSRVVRQIRASKLPDPRRTGNAGSFFKNPIVPVSVVEGIRERYPACPAYPVGTAGQEVKLAAGWLIEHAGLKGYRHRGAGVHSLQALVLVNLGHATQTDILELAITVRQRVFDTFGVVLEPEVWLYDSEMKPIVLPGCTA